MVVLIIKKQNFLERRLTEFFSPLCKVVFYMPPSRVGKPLYLSYPTALSMLPNHLDRY